MKKTFKLSIRTPQENILEKQVVSIYFANEEGDLMVLAHHANYMTTLQFSRVIVVDEKGNEETYMARNGLFIFDNKTNTGRMLALYAEHTHHVSSQTIQEYLAFLNEQLVKGEDLSQFQLVYLHREKLGVEKQIKQLG
ncbi:MAG: hypothetical protein AAB802_03610 [Patescibacteria group bacterium]